MENKSLLPELLQDKELSLKTTELNKILDNSPPKQWLKQHPTAANVRYIPIQRIEWLLSRIFQKWHVEVKDVKVIANSVVTIIRLHYFDPYIDNDWKWQDGIGAAPIQTDKGAAANDWTKVKADGVMKAAPASESYAVKDAAEKIGKIFGKDINRADNLALYVEEKPKPELSPKNKKWHEAIQQIKDGNTTVDAILKHYDISEENQKILRTIKSETNA